MNYEWQNFENRDMYQTVAPFLHGEEVLWLGRPYETHNYHPSIFYCIFSIFWCGFAIVWTVLATATGGLFGIFGLPFVVVGCYFVYTVFFGQRNRLRSTVYVVTDRRALIITERARGTTCTEYIFANLSNINLTSVKGTSGTICFLPQQRYYRTRNGFNDIGNIGMTTSFLMIDNVQSVYRLVSERISRAGRG